jgi:hypothetical protein
MRSEFQNGYWILCGGIIPKRDVKIGQKWFASETSTPVTVTQITDDNEWVTYESSIQPSHEKDNFSFQCRYCLVLESAEVPLEYRNV